MDGSHKLSAPLAAPLRPLAVQLASALTGGESVLVTGLDGTGAVLDAAGDALSYCRTRVLHVRPPLDLNGFMEQVVHAGAAPGGVPDLEQGFDALTCLDPSYDRIALLVEDAHQMPETTLRYIELALRAGPHLQVALAGGVEVSDTLALPGFSGLRKRLSLHLVLPAPDSIACVTDLFPAASAAPAGRYRGAWAVGAVAAFAAGLAVTVWMPAVPPAPPRPPAMAELLAEPPQTVAAQPENPLPAEAGNPATAALVEAIPAPSDAAPADILPASHPDVPTPQAVTTETQDARAVSAQDGADLPAGPATDPSPAAEPGLALSPPVVVEPPIPPALAFAEPSLIPPVAAPAEPHTASTAQAPGAALPDEAVPRPPALPPAPNPARRTPQARTERAAARAPVPNPDVRHCRDIVLRAQLGEDLTNGDQSFMRNGCR